MSYDQTRDRRADKSAPAEAGYNLTAAMVADGVDLPIYGKSFRLRNASAADVKIAVTPMHAAADASPMILTVGAGDREVFSLAVRRIWSTGSTGLAAGLTAGTVECQIFTE